MHILVADTQAEARIQLANELTTLGYKVTEAITSPEIMDKCRDKCPDLIVIENELSGAKGFEIIKQLRSLGGDASWNPILLMSKQPTAHDLTEGIEIGADGFLEKPVDVGKLHYHIQTAKRFKRFKEEVFSLAHELVMANHALESGTSQDAVTGIMDITAFYRVLEDHWQRAKQAQYPLALLLINCDCFRAYNDTQGAAQGDVVIKQVATALKSQLDEKQQIIARTTGDTFSVLFPKANEKTAMELAEKLRNSVLHLKIPHAKSQCNEFVTVSVGVTSSEQSGYGDNPLSLLEAADYALYQAKHAGRNQVGFATTEKV